MIYVGIDLHKETSWFYGLDEDGKKIISVNLQNDINTIHDFFKQLSSPFQVSLEATYNWYFLVDIAYQYTEHVFLANSYELKAFAKRHKKNDKIDARLIATVLWKGFLPTVYIPDQSTRQIRDFLNYRMKIVQDRCRNIHRLKSLIDKLGQKYPGDYTRNKALDRIDVQSFEPLYARVIQRYIDSIKGLSKQIFEVTKDIENLCEGDPDIINLLSIPGIGPFSAQLIRTEIIDVKRFKSFNRLCAYAGLAPRIYASAKKIYRGALNVNRRKNLEWILIENSIHFIKSDHRRIEKFERIKTRKGYNTAKVAMAREFLKVIFCVLKEQRPYRKNGHDQQPNIKIQSAASPALIGV